MIRLRVKEVAEAKGYNISSLSRAADIGLATMRKIWNKPESSVNTTTLEKIARVLNVDISLLLEYVPDS